MKRDYVDWKPAVDRFIERMEGGAWRHGLKTRDAAKEFLRLGKFPANPNSMWQPHYRKKNGDILVFLLYYWIQSNLKNRRWTLIGKSGAKLRPRTIYCVEHGRAHGEVDENGDPMAPEKEGLWLRWQDLTSVDVDLVRAGYRGRETDSGSDKRFLDATGKVLATKPVDTRAGDVVDEIARAL